MVTGKNELSKSGDCGVIVIAAGNAMSALGKLTMAGHFAARDAPMPCSARIAFAGAQRAFLAILLFLAIQQPLIAQLAPSASPEGGTGLAAKTLAVARRQMVAAANPLAAEAGLEILNAGGSAVDAAVAIQLVLNLVEPQSSGLGGGGFLLHWNPRLGQLKSYDGREAAPHSAAANQFVNDEGTPMPFRYAMLAGTSTGVPGIPHLLETAYRAHGRLPWGKLFEPALKLADEGFAVSPRLRALLAAEQPMAFDAAARSYFYDPQGAAWPVGHVLKNPAFAATLRRLAVGGAAAFYAGPIADAVVQSAKSAALAPSGMTLDDLGAYRAKERPPVCTTYRRHNICGMGPPSSAALTIGATLALLESFDLASTPMTPRALHLIAEAEKLAFADRDRYIADPDTTAVPLGMVNRQYLASRRALIDPNKAMTKAVAGAPPGLPAQRAGLDATVERAGTSHFAVVDAQGDAVAMTTTIEQGFGVHRMAAGFLLNNQLTDFSFRPVDETGTPIANAVAPGKRPRSSMAPTFIFGPDRRLKAIVGSAGGSAIILHVVKTIVGIIDWKLDAQEAIDLPNFGSRNGPFEIESKLGGDLLGLKMALYGQRVVSSEAPSGLQVIVRRPDGSLEGGADPRREGAARGN